MRGKKGMTGGAGSSTVSPMCTTRGYAGSWLSRRGWRRGRRAGGSRRWSCGAGFVAGEVAVVAGFAAGEAGRRVGFVGGAVYTAPLIVNRK
jgi:hypothetical protein